MSGRGSTEEATPVSSAPWFPRRRDSEVSNQRQSLTRRRSSAIETTDQSQLPEGTHRWWKFTLRPWDDDNEADWWFAGTAIPLVAATFAPLANVLSLAALVTSWRMCLVDDVDAAACPWDGNLNNILPDLNGTDFADPRWCYGLNVVSLVLGFVGNLFLLFNFTGRVRYIVALPLTIIMWYFATAILIAITIAMNVYVGPVRPQQTYTQGFWYAVLAAILYLVCSMLLMVNMLGYFLGHYPQRFDLTDSQRTLILQTMLFFVWLAGGGGVFARVESLYGNGEYNWSYVNALYFADVTILTVGFGDLVCTSNVGRGLVFPYSVGGIIILGLVISSISGFVGEIGSDKIIQRHVERSRARTYDRSITVSENDSPIQPRRTSFRPGERPVISQPFDPHDRSTALRIVDDKEAAKHDANVRQNTPLRAIRRAATETLAPIIPRSRKPRALILREEKDRFDAMRAIQHKTGLWKDWYALSLSSTAFGILWCVGALVFWVAERNAQGMTYFEGLYFCYVSLLTVGYGDFAPKSNLGRPFFVLWSLIAVPTMTILVSNLGDTVVNKFKNGINVFADFTVLPKGGIWHDLLQHFPSLLNFLQKRREEKDAEQRVAQGFETGPDPEEERGQRRPTLEKLATEEKLKPTEMQLAKKLAQSIRTVAQDMKEGRQQYIYEEWVEFTQLIRFTKTSHEEQDEEDLIEWDWIGENSPMMSRETEPEFVLDRLCESMGRYIRRLNPASGAAEAMKEGFLDTPTTAVAEEDGSSSGYQARTTQGISPDSPVHRFWKGDADDAEEKDT